MLNFSQYREQPSAQDNFSDDEDTPSGFSTPPEVPDSEPLFRDHMLTPTPRRPGLVNEIASVLRSMTITDKDVEGDNSSEVEMPSSVALLTPVRASKKHREGNAQLGYMLKY
jgi:hypothetical protein